MNTPHYLFDTDVGRAQQNAMGERLRAHLHNKSEPIAKAGAWWEYYVERYVEPKLEGLAGPDSCYHFKDAALYVYWAVTALYGLGFDSITPPSQRQTDALGLLAKGYGRRHVRGLQGLRDALTKEGINERDLRLFDEQCETFSASFECQVTAAHHVNLLTPTPSAVADAIRLFAQEMLRVCNWLDRTPYAFEALSVRPDIAGALTKLDTHVVAESARLTRKRY